MAIPPAPAPRTATVGRDLTAPPAARGCPVAAPFDQLHGDTVGVDHGAHVDARHRDAPRRAAQAEAGQALERGVEVGHEGQEEEPGARRGPPRRAAVERAEIDQLHDARAGFTGIAQEDGASERDGAPSRPGQSPVNSRSISTAIPTPSRQKRRDVSTSRTQMAEWWTAGVTGATAPPNPWGRSGCATPVRRHIRGPARSPSASRGGPRWPRRRPRACPAVRARSAGPPR